jgi:hypothetical protein
MLVGVVPCPPISRRLGKKPDPNASMKWELRAPVDLFSAQRIETNVCSMCSKMSESVSCCHSGMSDQSAT